MGDRKTFLTAVGAVTMLVARGARASAQNSPAPQPSTSSASVAAAAVAATMRRFDPKLSDAELATIAAAIDENAGAGRALNDRGKKLKNSDAPVTVFAVSTP